MRITAGATTNNVLTYSPSNNGKTKSFMKRLKSYQKVVIGAVISVFFILCLFFGSSSRFSTETIAVILVSYHGASCIGAIETALSFAKYPQRISFFIANAEQDADSSKRKSCLNGYDKNGIIGTYFESITETFSNFYGLSAIKAELIQTEMVEKDKSFDFVMEVYANSLFNNNWDIEGIAEWTSLKDPKTVLTTTPIGSKEIHSRPSDPGHDDRTINVMCSAMVSFDNDDKDVQILYDHPWEIRPPKQDNYGNYLPCEVPFWSPFFSFGPFNYLMDVKNDPQLKVMTHEEGISFLYSMRLRTNGYRMYAPVRDLVFHNYAFDERNKNMHSKKDIDGKQMRKDQDRMNKLLAVEEDENILDFEEDEYGIGCEMSVSEYYENTGINLKEHTAGFLCEKIRKNEWHS